jgi:hypothetical protein
LLNPVRDHRSRAGRMLQLFTRIIDLAVVTLIFSAFT